MDLPLALNQKIIDFLSSLPNIHDSESQRALLLQAGLDSQLQAQIPVGKPPAQFIPSLISILLSYGKLNDTQYALEAVLKASKNYIGQDRQTYCESLLDEFRSYQRDLPVEDDIKESGRTYKLNSHEIKGTKKQLYINSKLKVFISYAKEDHTIAKQLYDDLKQANITPWLDSEDLIPGQNWKLVIPQIIKESSYVLVLLSSHSVSKKGFIQREVKIALDIAEELSSPFDIFIIPVRLDKTEPMEDRLQVLHWVDIFDSYEKGLRQILRVFAAEQENNKTAINDLSYENQSNQNEVQYQKVSITPKTYFDKNDVPIERGYAFVLFFQKPEDICVKCIKQAVREAGVSYHPIYLKTHTNLKDIFDRIQKAETFIADITDCPPDMMWILGVALTIKEGGRIIILQKKSEEALPFTIYQHEISYTYNPLDLENLNELQRTLVKVILSISKEKVKATLPIKDFKIKTLMKDALIAVEQKNWITAETLFEAINREEPNNWYVLNQWGIMLRNKNEFQNAFDKFQEALSWTKIEAERAYIYTELAVLHYMSDMFDEAEKLFYKAEHADNTNTYVYKRWAEFYESQGGYQNAEFKIENLLKRLDREHPDYEEFQLRHSYYSRKIDEPYYKKNFDEYKRERSMLKVSDEVTIIDEKWENLTLPYNITWEGLKANYRGKVVAAQINNIHSRYGIFVDLSKEFTGLIHRSRLPEDFEQKFSIMQPIKVRIVGAKVNPVSGRKELDLSLISNKV